MSTPTFLIALALALAASAARAETAVAAGEQGRRVAERKCAACHALDGVHASPNPSAPAFPDIGRRFLDRDLDRRLSQVTRQGHYSMPPRATSADEREALAAFIRDGADHGPPATGF